MYFPTWLVPKFLSSIIHLKCLLSLVLVLRSRLVWGVPLTLSFTHNRVPVLSVLTFWAVLLLAVNWFFVLVGCGCVGLSNYGKPVAIIGDKVFN